MSVPCVSALVPFTLVYGISPYTLWFVVTTRSKFVPHAVPHAMGQEIVFGMDCGTRKLDMVSDIGVLRKKSLFYGRVEAYFAVYDSLVLTGPGCARW